MDAKEAYYIATKFRSQNIVQKGEMRAVLDIIFRESKNGKFECNYFNDEILRKDLKLMGYKVSNMWKETGRYKSEMMTISWEQ